ncbi:phage tail protein [Desulfofustis limnaeus]|uniref:Minor tail protein n=1 Tax=Desulfofustis limnaeus TaxID=2740163 RepID=A0ABM7WCM2_9BACT|nr:phage tail protein [Desulfofustis limnaeus]BDD88705.1 hypothetical protein DPPLL_30700 [Desulfofustis limnaeus]
MLNGFEITGDIDELRELTKGIAVAEKALKRAVVSALNKTAVSGRAWLVKAVPKKYNLKAKDIRASITISKANFNRPQAVLFGGPGVALMKYSPDPDTPPSTRQMEGFRVSIVGRRGMRTTRKRTLPGTNKYFPLRGISVEIHRGSRKVVDGAFVAKMPSGHVGVFRRAKDGRKGKRSRRTVIEELYGPSALRILDSDADHIPFDDFIGETLDKNMAHEADYYLKKEGVLPRV